MRGAVIVVLLGTVTASHAAFERLPLSPESAALGGLLAVSPDPVFGNAAALCEASGPRIEATGSRPFGLPELTDAQVAVGWSGARGGAAVGFRRFGSIEYREKEVRLTSAWSPAGELSGGIALRGLSVEGPAFAPQRTAALDVALHAVPDPDTRLGATLEAVLGTLPGDPEGRLRRTAVGVARTLARSLTLHLEVQRREDRPLAGVVGLAWTPVAPLTLRVGAREGPPAAAWGFSARLPGATLSTSVTEHPALGRTVRLGLLLTPAPATNRKNR